MREPALRKRAKDAWTRRFGVRPAIRTLTSSAELKLREGKLGEATDLVLDESIPRGSLNRAERRAVDGAPLRVLRAWISSR